MSDSRGIGARVRAARERLGWSREALAFHAGISWSAIAQVESGRRTDLRPSTLVALARPLGVSIDYLVGGTTRRRRCSTISTSTTARKVTSRRRWGPFWRKGVERSDAVLAVTTLPNIGLLREHLGKQARKVEFVDSSYFLSTPVAALEAFRAFLRRPNLTVGATWVRILAEPRWAGADTEMRLGLATSRSCNSCSPDAPMTSPVPMTSVPSPRRSCDSARHTSPGTRWATAGPPVSPVYLRSGGTRLGSRVRRAEETHKRVPLARSLVWGS